ncbi:MAG: SAM-dependent methyltransferase [Bacilli bacterium]|nr:SAM-dependent methyltransferase [Bacilli bacterium]
MGAVMMTDAGSLCLPADDRFSLKDGERVDFVGEHQRFGIIQSDEVFSFSLDALFLGQFATVHSSDRVIDLGTGNGILPLLLLNRAYQPKQVIGVEIQPRLADMATRSVLGNGLQKKIEIVRLDLKNAVWQFGAEQFDLVVSNPPYRPQAAGDASQNEHKRIAKHEIYCTLEEVIGTAARLVKTGGKVAFVHRADRLVDVLFQMRINKVEPKRLRLVHPYIDREPSLVLVEGIKNGGPELRILPPLIVHEQEGTYTAEIKELYARS